MNFSNKIDEVNVYFFGYIKFYFMYIVWIVFIYC